MVLRGGEIVLEIELHGPPAPRFDVRISPALALAMTLPAAELGGKFPGLDPWLAQLPSRLGRTIRADVRLLCVPLSGVLSYLFEGRDTEESMQPLLDALAATPAEEYHARAVARLAAETEDRDEEAVRRWINEEPQRLAELIAAMPRPSPDHPFAIDVERALHLLRHPAELKAMVELRLRQLWHDHFAPRWREALPHCRALAEEARRLLDLEDPAQVLQAILGRKLREQRAALLNRRIVFVPIPFLGPYISVADEPDLGAVYLGFGLVHGETFSAETARRDLLAVLKALADEARLEALAYIRDRGEARAADLMERFGWSQSTTSRHLCALESTGLLRSERIDGVKHYTVDAARARAVARHLERFFTEE